MDAPQFPDADAAQPQAGLQTPGQASAFRRALDAQAAAPEQSRALVPTGPHDLTAPIDVDELRAALAFHTAIDAAQAGMVHAWHAAVSTDVVAIPPAPPGPPSPSGPTVVMPSVAVPVLRVPTTITPTGPSTVQIAMQPGQAVSAQRAPQLPTAQPATAPGADPQPAGPGDAGAPPQNTERSPRHDGGASKPSRLSTAVGISALLAAFAGAALVLIDNGRSNAPLAPTALPTKSTSHHAAAAPSPHPPATSHSPSPSPSPSHSPSHSPTPSPSRSASATASALSGALAHFQTIQWTTQPDPAVVDIQRRLAQLHYLTIGGEHGGGGGWRYADTQRTLSHFDWTPPPDQFGVYQNATESAVRAFRYDYMLNDQGPFPPQQGCDAATYQALINATR